MNSIRIITTTRKTFNNEISIEPIKSNIKNLCKCVSVVWKFKRKLNTPEEYTHIHNSFSMYLAYILFHLSLFNVIKLVFEFDNTTSFSILIIIKYWYSSIVSA